MFLDLILIGVIIYLLYALHKLRQESAILKHNQKILYDAVVQLRDHAPSTPAPQEPAPVQASFYAPGVTIEQHRPAPQEPPAQKTPAQEPPVAQAFPASQPPIDLPRADADPDRDTASGAKSLENWVGRNLIGVVAAILIFIGITFFGMLVYVMAGDLVKITLIYLFSAALTLVGLWLNRRRTNYFTQLLIGCGCGAFFISILLTHLVFGYLSFGGALCALLVWLALTLYLAKAASSVVVTVVAHLGMIVSVFYAYTIGFSAERLPYLAAYQFAAAALTLLNSLLFHKKTYLLGAFSALVLNLFACVTILGYFSPELPPNAIWFFIPQLAVASAMSFLISRHISRGDFAAGSVWAGDRTLIRMAAHIAAKLLWLGTFFIVIDRVLSQCLSVQWRGTDATVIVSATVVASAIALLLLLVHMGVSVFLGTKRRLDAALERISVLLCCAVMVKYLLSIWTVNLFSNGVFPVPFVMLLALLLFGMEKLRRDYIYTIAAYVALALDLLLMLPGGYGRLVSVGTAALAFAYMALYPAVLAGHWRLRAADGRASLVMPYRMAVYGLIHLSVPAILSVAKVANHALISAVALTALNTALYLLTRGGAADSRARLWHRFTSIAVQLVLVVDLLTILWRTWIKPDTTVGFVLVIVLSVLSIALCVLQLVRSAAEPNETRIIFQLLGSVTLNALILALIHLTTPLFDSAYVFSLVCMVIALCFIIAGFVTRSNVFRLYGLVVTLTCVLKLVTYDVSTQNTLLRVAALIGGGIICFVISGIYNYSVKRIGLDEEKPEDEDEITDDR